MKKTNKRLFLDIHIIQTIPPSNINRDDVGSPKTAQYGGVLRARVSSQSWKSAMRDYFRDNDEPINLGVRTKKGEDLIKNEFENLQTKMDKKTFDKKVEQVFKKLKIKPDKGKKDVLFFWGNRQIKRIAEIISNSQNKEFTEPEITALEEAIKIPSLEIALFGRMLASNIAFNVDASAQVAHAISTHEISNEFDFFTAVDDFKKESQGAGHLDSHEFNSSTLYRYANVAIHELQNQLKDDTLLIDGIKLFVKSFITSIPTGKINSYANQTIPQAILISLRNDRPISLVSAFEKPVETRKDGYVSNSIKKLIEEKDKIEKIVPKPIKNFFITTIDDENIAKVITDNTLNELEKSLENEIKKELKK